MMMRHRRNRYTGDFQRAPFTSFSREAYVNRHLANGRRGAEYGACVGGGLGRPSLVSMITGGLGRRLGYKL